jgi:hypothetical protein
MPFFEGKENDMKTDADAKRREVIRPTNPRDSSRVAPLRIGGRDEFGRQRVASSLELAGDVLAPEPSSRLVIDDWKRFEGLLRLTLIQQIVFNGHFKKGIERHRLPRALGLTPRQVSSALDAIDTGLTRLRNGPRASSFSLVPATQSLSLVYREQLQTGRRIYTLSRLDQTFLDVIANERSSLFSQRDRSQIAQRQTRSVTIGVGRPMSTIDKLERTVTGERGKLDALIDKQTKAWAVRRELGNDYLSIEVGRSAGSWEANQELVKLRPQIDSADRVLDAIRAEVGTQNDAVEAAEGKLHLARREAAALAIAPLKKPLFDAMRSFTEAAAKIRAVSHQHGFYDGFVLGQELFPADAPAIYPCADIQGRSTQASLISAALALDDYLHSRYTEAAFEVAS